MIFRGLTLFARGATPASVRAFTSGAFSCNSTLFPAYSRLSTSEFMALDQLPELYPKNSIASLKSGLQSEIAGQGVSKIRSRDNNMLKVLKYEWGMKAEELNDLADRVVIMAEDRSEGEARKILKAVEKENAMKVSVFKKLGRQIDFLKARLYLMDSGLILPQASAADTVKPKP
jgi:hypothetical protein